MFSLELPHTGNSNKYTQYTIFKMNKKNTQNYPKTAPLGFSKGLQNELETAMVNKPSVFEPLKFYCSKPKVMSALHISITDFSKKHHK